MRTAPFLFSVLAATLISSGAVTARAADGKYYDPSNAASPTGNTSGHELFRTIGCPGKGLFDTPCPVPPPPAPAPAPVAEPAPPPPPPPAPVVAPAPKKKLVLEGVNFDHDRAKLRDDAFPILDKAAEGLKEWGDVKVEVAGYTDSRGSAKYNLRLSQARAEAVRTYLIGKGIAADRLTAKGYGEANPVADNKTEEGRFHNRRVELVEQK